MKLETKKPKYEKSGEMTGAVGAVIQLIVGVGVAVLVLIFVGVLGGQSWQIVQEDIETLSQAVSAKSVTVLNSTAVSLGYTDVINGSVTVFNGSNSVALTKFTFDYTAGTTTLLDVNFNNTALNFSFGYGDIEIESSIKNSILSGFEALNQTGDYLPIIVLAVIIALVLGIVLMYGGGLNGGSGGKLGSAL